MKPWAPCSIHPSFTSVYKKELYYVEVQIFLGKKYSAQQDDFLNPYKTNNGPMSFLPINSRCTQRLTRLFSSCFVAHVSSESVRSIVLLKQCSVARSLLWGWKFQIEWLLMSWKGAVLDALSGNIFFFKFPNRNLGRCRSSFQLYLKGFARNFFK